LYLYITFFKSFWRLTYGILSGRRDSTPDKYAFEAP
jgi:hypothetical protein